MFKNELPNPFKATMRQKFKKNNDGQNSTLKAAKKGELVQPFKKGAFHPSHKGSFLPQQTL